MGEDLEVSEMVGVVKLDEELYEFGMLEKEELFKV